MENPYNNLENELNKLFDSHNYSSLKISLIVSSLNLANLNNKKEIKFSSKSLTALYLYRKIKGNSNYQKLLKSTTEEDWFNLGFYKNENDNLEIPSKRNLNYFIRKNKDVLKELDCLTERIIDLSTKKGIVLDFDTIERQVHSKKDISNKKNQAIKETIKLVKKLIYPKISIKTNHNIKFTTKDLLDILVHVAYSHDFVNNGCSTFKEINSSINIPNPDTILYRFKKLNNILDIEQVFGSIFDFIFNFAKKNYRILSKREIDLAIDVNKIPYYGKIMSPNYIKGGFEEGIGTRKFLHFITCNIVVAGRRFTIDAMPMHPFDSLEDLVDKIIKRAKSKIKIRYCYMDRGFDNASIINVLKRNNVKFIMPKVKSYTVKAWYDKSEDSFSRVIKEFRIGENVTTNLVLVNDEDGVKRAFSTNIDVPDNFGHYLFYFYKNRWGIETSYRLENNDFLARTTSRNFNLRLFYYLFSVCLYNLWVLVNICVSLRVYGRLYEKPVITAKLFAILLYKIREEYALDPGG